MRRFMLIVTSALAFALGSRPKLAVAFERQWHAGIDAGYASLFSQESKSGFGGGAHLAYGLSDAWNALLEADVSYHPGGAPVIMANCHCDPVDRRSRTVWSGALGLAYTLDIARAVPYAGALLALYDVRGADAPSFVPGGQLALGLDYELERNWAIGVQFRMHALLQSPVSAYATTFLRAEYVWGF